MNWFEKMCRNVGLMVHNVKRPEGGDRKEVSRKVEEKKDGNVILRRTTIDEIEVKPDRDEKD